MSSEEGMLMIIIVNTRMVEKMEMRVNRILHDGVAGEGDGTPLRNILMYMLIFPLIEGSR